MNQAGTRDDQDGSVRRRRHRGLVLAALLAVLALLAAACGGDDGEEATTDTAAGTEQRGEGDADDETVAAPSGEPIKLGSVLTINNPAWSNENVRLVNEAWENYVNEELGGINGRPLEVTSCDDEGDPGKTVQCTQDLIDDGVVAFVNNSSLAFGPNALAIVEGEGIPSIGGWPISPPEYASDLNFPTTPGASGSYPSLVVYAHEHGAESLALVFTDTPGGHAVNDAMIKQWEELNGGPFTGVSFDPTAADFVPTLTRVADADPDALVLAVGEGAAPRMFQAAAQVGLDDVMILGTGTAATEAVFSTAGDAVEDVFFSVPTLPADLEDNEDVQKYREIMEEYGPDVELSPQSGVAASSIQYAVDVLMAVEGEITSEAIVEVLKDPPVAPFMAHSMSPEQAPKDLPAVWNPYAVVVQYSDGALTPVGEDVEESDHVSRESGVTWFTGFVPGE